MANKEQEQELHNKAYELRLSGMTYRQIAARLGISHVTAMRWCTEHMETVSIPLKEQQRKMEYDRLTRVLERLEARAEDGDDKALMGIVKVSERLSKMMGLDMPTEISVERKEVTQVDLAIQDLISETNARNAVRKAAASALREEQASDELSDAVEQIVLEN